MAGGMGRASSAARNLRTRLGPRRACFWRRLEGWLVRNRSERRRDTPKTPASSVLGGRAGMCLRAPTLQGLGLPSPPSRPHASWMGSSVCQVASVTIC